MKNFILSLAVLCLFHTSNADTYPKNPNIDILHYQFQLKLSDQHDSIHCKATIFLLLKKDGIQQLRFDLTDVSASRQGKGMKVMGISINGQALQYSHQNEVILVSIPPSSLNQKLAVVIEYKGIPDAGLAIKPNRYNDRTFFSDNWPNLGHHWLPLVDHPYDKATCEFLVTAPAHYQVVSNGLLQEESMLNDGNKFTHWKQSVPIAPWLFVLGVAKFAVQYVDAFEGKSIQTWVYHQDRDAGFYDFATPSKKVLSFYSEYIGPFTYEKLANIQSNNSTGGMEAASAIMYSEKSVSGKRDVRWQNVIVHEIAHQWFGDAVTEADWDDVWLSEGFATYFTLMFVEHDEGTEAFKEGLKSSREQIKKYLASNEPSSVVHHQLSDMAKVTSAITYQKGAWTLHMLRNKVGEENFQKGIRSYYEKYFNINATTDNFITEMETASGIQLSEFFSQWLHRIDIPKIKGQWKWNESTKQVSITVTQIQKSSSYTLPVEIGFFSSESNSKIEKIDFSKPSATYTFKFDKKPLKVVLDPNLVLLAEIDFVEK